MQEKSEVGGMERLESGDSGPGVGSIGLGKGLFGYSLQDGKALRFLEKKKIELNNDLLASLVECLGSIWSPLFGTI